MRHFKPYANESDVLRIGALEIENRIDRITLTGDVVLTQDKAGLALAKALQALLNEVVKALEAEKQLPNDRNLADNKLQTSTLLGLICHLSSATG